MPASVETRDALDATTLSEVRALIAQVAREDGREPLSDQALTHLTSRAVEHAIAREDGRLTGYAQLDGRSLEIAAEPASADALLDTFAGRPALVWSHGRAAPLIAVLERHGFRRTRELHQLRRSLTEPPDVPPVPDGVEIRPFVPGSDEDAWTAVNAAAFAQHSEQGSWTREDLEARERESWFDPTGFLMAWRGAELTGFHWTKIHGDGLGEVYVIGVAPAAQGLGLGKVLLQYGLVSLRDRGCDTAMLYVDGDNTTAMRLYERAGFHRHDLDVQWAPDQSSLGTVSNT